MRFLHISFLSFWGGRGECCGSKTTHTDWGILPQKRHKTKHLLYGFVTPSESPPFACKSIVGYTSLAEGEVYAGIQYLCRFSKFEGHKRDTWRDTKRDTRQTLGNTGLVGILETPGALRWCLSKLSKSLTVIRLSYGLYDKIPNALILLGLIVIR